MGLFDAFKKKDDLAQKIRQKAVINLNSMDTLCGSLRDSAETFVTLSETEDWFSPYTEQAIKITQQAMDAFSQSIAAYKEKDINISAPIIEKNLSLIERLHDEVSHLFKEANEEGKKHT